MTTPREKENAVIGDVVYQIRTGGSRPHIISAAMTVQQAQAIRDAHWAMDARCRGKDGPHTVTDCVKLIRELLDLLGSITGIESAADVLPFEDAS